MKTNIHRKRQRSVFQGLEWILPLALFSAVSVTAIVDFDGNGLDDVWENYYSATGLSLHGDADFDGVGNYEESIAGTDPLSAVSVTPAMQS